MLWQEYAYISKMLWCIFSNFYGVIFRIFIISIFLVFGKLLSNAIQNAFYGNVICKKKILEQKEKSKYATAFLEDKEEAWIL